MWQNLVKSKLNDKYLFNRVRHFIKKMRITEKNGKKIKISQEILAEKFGKTKKFIYNMERGDKPTRLSESMRYIGEIALVTDISPDILVNRYFELPQENNNNYYLSDIEKSLLNSFRKISPEIRRKYAELGEISNEKFSLALEIQSYPATFLRKTINYINEARELKL